MRLLKFGGTSVANAERFLSVADIALKASAKEQTFLVLSAPAGVTNLLVDLVAAGISGSDGGAQIAKICGIVEPIIRTLSERYADFDKIKVLAEFNSTISEIKRLTFGIAMLRQCPDEVNAFIESRGETFSISVMAELLNAMGKKVRVLDPVEMLMTSGDVMEASVDIDASKERYRRIADDPEAITLMAGFCGGSPDGKLMLLGRNGSDYSAACLAAICGADICEIWTDVDGVYSCDPHLVPDAVLLKQISYKEAMELSYFGAKVLHPKTIAPIARYHIPCLIKNTGNPDGAGTLISEETDPDVRIKGISALKNISLINISGPWMKGMVGMAGRLFTAISRSGISIILITQASSEYSISFCIPTNEVARAKEVISDEFSLELKENLLDPVENIDDCAIISVVGDGMRSMCGTAGRFFRALAEANVNVNAIAQGSSERSISAVISGDKVSEAISICHTAFFNSIQRLDLIVVGVGGVGGEMLNQIKQQQKSLKAEQGIDIRVVGIANSKHFMTDSQGIDLDDYKTRLVSADNEPFSRKAVNRLIHDSHLVNPILVDCTSDEDMALSYADFMRDGLHIVTPNKKANTSGFDYYQELRSTARRQNRKFLYEANVGAGLPVLHTLQDELAAGDRLIEFSGIMSGTLSYLFGLVEDGATLSEATRDAYEKGFTEPNPRDDLEGRDVARKLLILARECGYPLELSDVEVEPAVDPKYLTGANAAEVLENLKNADAGFSDMVAKAKAEGKVLRYVGSIKNGKCRCSVTPVGPSDPLFKVRGGENALAFTTAYYQPIPLVIRGYGAGTSVTAAGVLADVLRLQNWTREV